MAFKLSQLATAAAMVGTEYTEVAQLSSSVTITATTITKKVIGESSGSVTWRMR